jgi:predicted nucleotidyltransferase
VDVVGGKVLYDGRTLAEWAPVVADRIYRRCNAQRIVLFGSVARGEDGADSDIDLLVVLPTVRRRHDAAVAVLRELRDLPVPVDVAVVDPAGLQRESRVPGLVRAALREGRELAADAA